MIRYLTLAFVLLVAATPVLVNTRRAHAYADGPGCAVVIKTPDGFLNLRRALTAKAPIVAKLRPGDRLYVSTSEAGIYRRGIWALVDGVWRLDGNQFVAPKERYSGWQPHSGWAAIEFIQEMKCPDEMPR
jgi:hypothetical protein